MRHFRSKVLLALAVAAVIAAFLAIALARPDERRLWGDEGTFVAMTASLVGDGDLVFDDADLERLVQHPDDPAPTVILQQTDRGITYSKPLLYPLLAAPLFAVLGESGMVATNILALAAALILAWIYLRRLAGATEALWTLFTFVLASVVLAYLGWKMSDLVLLSLTLAGLLLALGGRRAQIEDRPVMLPLGGIGAAILGGLILGMTVSMRFTTAALVAAVTVALFLDKRGRRGMVVGVLSVVGFLAVSGITVALLGTANPYKSVRSSFNQASGYPAGEAAEKVSERFASRPATQSATWRPPLDVRRTAYSTLYFFVGRHTGLLFYFPAAVVLLLHILRRPDRISMTLLAGVVAIVGFYLIWMPQNYFGGSTFVGNRYFLGAFPALLVGLTRLPSKRNLTVAWVLALVAWGSAVHSAYSVRGLDGSSQIHAYSGVFRRLPFESTAQRIDGLADRFWADDFVRFLDPFAKAAPWSFRLDSSRPATELLVATDWRDQPLHFVVSPSTAKVAVEVRDWRGQSHFSLPRPAPEPPGLLAVDTSEPWRHHAYWWRARKLYDSRVLRFSLIGDGEDAVTAVVRYAGKGRELAPLEAELFRIEPALPGIVTAGSVTEIVIKARNTGRRPWKQQGLFPSAIGYRLVSRVQGELITAASTPMPNNVPTGSVVEVPVVVQWPDEPGDYQIGLYVLRSPAAALRGLGRLRLKIEDIRVEPRSSPDTPEP